MKNIFLFGIMFLLVSCQPNSLEEFQWEGTAYVRSLLQELQTITSQEELSQASSTLEKHFEALVDIMIRARIFQQKHRSSTEMQPSSDIELSVALQKELERIYQIEGGRECIEKAQREAMLRLDVKEKALARQLQTLYLR